MTLKVNKSCITNRFRVNVMSRDSTNDVTLFLLIETINNLDNNNKKDDF